MKYLIIALLLSVSVSGCAQEAENQGSGHEQQSSDLYLRLERDHGRVHVFIVNDRMQSISVNRLFRIWGSDAEVTFVFPEGVGENRKLVTRGLPHIASPGDSIVSLEPSMIYGRHYDLKTIQEIYGLTPGCYLAKAVYSNKMPDLEVERSELVSNELELCFK